MSRHSRKTHRAACLAVLAVLAALSSSVAAPPTANLRQAGLDGVAVWQAPRVDVDRLLAEDEASYGKRVPHRIGTALEAGLTPADSGSWHREDGRRVWRIVLHSAGAHWLLPVFGGVHLEPGAELQLYDPEGRTRLGPYTGDQVIDGRLGLPPIDGDTLVVEIDWPDDRPIAKLGAHLERVLHGYRSLTGVAQSACDDPSGACNIDVNCPLGDAWQDEKRGVVKIFIPELPPGTNVATCSGALVNNTSLDCTPYVLTADHCFTDQPPDLVNTTFIFDYERPGCGPGSASQTQFATTALHVARHPVTDFRLLEVFGAIPGEGLYFNGWSRLGAPPPNAYTIHHPKGAPRKISYTALPVIGGDGDPYPADHWRVVRWEQGVVEFGSSGAPLFDPAGRIVGQLNDGTSECDGSQPNAGGDNFGRLDVSWDIHPSLAGLRLKDWLDPAGTDAILLNGMDQSFCGSPQAKLTYSDHVVDENQGNRDGILDPGDIAQVHVQLTNAGPLAAGSAEDGVTGTLSLADPQETEVAIIVDEAHWPQMTSGMVSTSAQPHFTVDVAQDRLCGKSILFDIEAESEVATFRVGTGAPSGYVNPFEDDMELGVGDWTVSPAGSWSQSIGNSAPGGGVTSWFAPDITSAGDALLIMPSFGSLAALPELAEYSGLPPGLLLSFDHDLNSECGSDGGVLEYSTDGASWQDAGPRIVEGGYNSVILSGSALAGRDAWSGDLGGWTTVLVDFSDLEGAGDLHLRWRFATDGTTGGVGWYVDNVVLQAPVLECSPPHRRNVPGAFCRGHLGAGPWPLALCGAGPGRSSGRR